MRIQPITPYYYIAPPMRRKHDQPEEISFCGHIRRLVAIHQRHIMLQRLWDVMTSFLRFGSPREATRFNRVV